MQEISPLRKTVPVAQDKSGLLAADFVAILGTVLAVTAALVAIAVQSMSMNVRRLIESVLASAWILSV